jgi:hypothetical protein
MRAMFLSRPNWDFAFDEWVRRATFLAALPDALLLMVVIRG